MCTHSSGDSDYMDDAGEGKDDHEGDNGEYNGAVYNADHASTCNTAAEDKFNDSGTCNNTGNENDNDHRADAVSWVFDVEKIIFKSQDQKCTITDQKTLMWCNIRA